MVFRSLLTALALLSLLGLSTPLAAGPSQDVARILREHIGFSDSDFEKMSSGESITRLLETGRNDEVAVFGVIWIDVPIAFFLERYQDIESFESGPKVEAIGKLSNPARLADFDRFALTSDDIKDIKKCRPGNCGVKLSEYAMQRFHEEVEWSAADAEDQANALARQLGLEHVQAYVHGGNEELGRYQDKKQPQTLAEEFHGLLQNSPYLPEYIPELHQYLEGYPAVELPRGTDFLYWSRVKFGLKPILRINHVVIYRDSDDHGAEAAIASKQIYSSHYFRAALELRFLVKDQGRPSGFYLMSVNRARVDGLTGFTGLLLRGTIRNRTRDGLESFLRAAKKKLEKEYGTGKSD
jgi:hypothetical protein